MAAIAVALIAGSAPAFAQTNKEMDLAVGRWVATPSGFRIFGGDNRLWVAQGSVRMTPHWSLVGEIDRLHGPDAEQPDPGQPYAIYTDWSILAGVRQQWVKGAITPYWQVLAGGLTGVARYSARPSWNYSYSTPVLQPGGGITFMPTKYVGVRAEYDLVFRNPNVVSSDARLITSVVVRFGKTPH